MTEKAASPGPSEWWLCPNGECEHGAVLHDVDEYEDRPTCCVEGCTCGHRMPDNTKRPVPLTVDEMLDADPFGAGWIISDEFFPPSQ